MVDGLTVPGISALAAVDAINPCALAVLVLVLVAILVRYPRDRKKVLLVGLTFTLAVFIFYFIYGLIIIQAFKAFVEMTAEARLWLYKALGALAIIIGAFNVKDFFRYGGGGFVMEVPRGWRPRMKRLISGTTSAPGAFVIGAFVSVFLLPCTVGPYIIAGGMLSVMETLAAVPWLVYYNVIFVLPMIAVTLAVYAGFTTVERTSGWREKNIRRLHLVAGLILICLGAALLLGLVY
jgi:cytochrome c biogenesis protein CcdA